MRSGRLIIAVCCIFLLMVLVCPGIFAQKAVTVKYAFWGNPAAIGVEEDIIKEFMKANPKIRVEPVVSGYDDYHTKIMTMIAGGMSPDVMRIDSYYFMDFVKTGVLMCIDPLIERDKLNLDLYYEAGLPDSMHEGRMYGLPWGTAPLYVVYNTKMFKDANIEFPKEGWTWDDFVKTATAIAGGEGATRRYGFGDGFLIMSSILPFIWGTGGDVFDNTRAKFTLDEPQVLNRLDEIAGLIKNKVFANPLEFTSADVVTRWFAQNRIAIRVASAQDILGMQAVGGLDFGVIHFPVGKNVLNTTIFKSNTVSISADTKNVEAAWTFLKFLREPGGKGDILYAKSRRIPPTSNVPELWDLYVDPTKPPKGIAEITHLISSKYGRELPLREGWLEIEGILLPALQKIWTGQTTAAQAIREAKPRIEEVMRRYN